MSEVEACKLIFGFGALLLLVNLVVSGVVALAMIKLYTESFKELRHDRRERAGVTKSPVDPEVSTLFAIKARIITPPLGQGYQWKCEAVDPLPSSGYRDWDLPLLLICASDLANIPREMPAIPGTWKVQLGPGRIQIDLEKESRGR